VLISPSVEEAGTEYHGEKTPGRLKVAVFDLGGCSLELLEPVGGPSVWQTFIDERGEGIHHIGFLTDDIDKGATSLEDAGMPLVQQASYDHGFGKGRYAYFASESRLGAMIELNELK
jgi:methylmalonyl-CoA/ethylmalonyl-CoA epimerase